MMFFFLFIFRFFFAFFIFISRTRMNEEHDTLESSYWNIVFWPILISYFRMEASLEVSYVLYRKILLSVALFCCEAWLCYILYLYYIEKPIKKQKYKQKGKYFKTSKWNSNTSVFMYEKIMRKWGGRKK